MREVEASHTCVVATVGLRVLLWTKNSGEHSAGSSGVLKGELGAGSSGVLKGELGACSSSVLKGDMMRSISDGALLAGGAGLVHDSGQEQFNL